MHNQDISIDDFLEEALQTAKLFLSSKKSLSVEEIIENPLLQKAICQTIVNYWKNPKAQNNFLLLLGMLPQDIFIEMLSSIGEMFKDNPNLVSEEDQEKWCLEAATYLESKDDDEIDQEAIEEGKEFLFMLISGDDINNYSFGEDDEDENTEEDDDEDNDNEEDSHNLEDYRERENSFFSEEENDNFNDPKNDTTIIEDKVEEKINMNPTRLATSMLSGIAPNYATQVYMMKNKSFAKAYVNALSLQTVIGDLQNVKGIQERFIKGLAWLEDDIFDYSWTILCSRRNDLSQDWPEANKKEWLKFIESQKYPKDKKDKIINILKLKNEKPNPYSKISKYYYENGKFAEDAFDEKIDEKGMVLYAQALAKDAVPNWKSTEHDTLSLFAEAIKFLDVEPFEMAIQTLVETFDANQTSLNLEDKKSISFKILEQVGEANPSGYDDYREILINAITGYNKMVPTQKKTEEEN